VHSKALVTSEEKDREQVVPKVWDMKNSRELHRPHLLAINNGIEDHSTLPCRVDNVMVS
jgi:hypothetical protein